ncbi:MAG TPA: HD domain-containing phosphohydrolase [Gemmatimonadaceae bacterium]|nr:HD domain-containing phosphohydrolase [Gemmatimonadaceae bacterium]
MPSPLRPAATAAALAALWLHERRRRRAAERFGAAAFESLLNAIDANDADTGRHVRRVAAYAIELADAAGCDEETRREIEHVALFHDIGKIHAALFDIVHDGAALTAEDRAAIATHPERGAEVLAPLAAFYPHLAEGVRSHHERWDGTGYPRGLAGAAIPFAARIVAIADSFDAVTHARRYSAGQSFEDGARAIRRGRGTQFDPRLVDLFLTDAVQRRIRAARAALDRGVPRGRDERRHSGHEPAAPEVTFRWRSRSPVH